MHFKRYHALLACCFSICGFGYAGVALAHHPMEGATPATFWEGLASGLAHPVIELDHLAFLLGLGVLVAFLKAGRRRLVVAFIALSLAGTLLHAAGVALPLNQAWIALTLLVAAGVILLQCQSGLRPALLFSAAAGLGHGYAFGEAIVGAQSGTLHAYLLGLGLVQATLVWVIAASVARLEWRWAQSISRTVSVLCALLGILGLARATL